MLINTGVCDVQLKLNLISIGMTLVVFEKRDEDDDDDGHEKRRREEFFYVFLISFRYYV